MRKSGILILALFAATAAQAQTRYVFRVPISTVLTTAVPAPIDPDPPETPEPPAGNVVLQFNGQGMLTHLDANGNNLIDGGDSVTGTFRVTNTGDAAANNPTGDGNFYILNPYTASVVYKNLGLPISCPAIAPGTSVDCTVSFNVATEMLPVSRVDYYVAFEMSLVAPNYVTQISEFVPLGLP